MEDPTHPASPLTASEYMLGGLAVEMEYLAGMAHVIFEAQIRILARLEDADEQDLKREFDESLRQMRQVARGAMMDGPVARWPVWDVLPSDGARPAGGR